MIWATLLVLALLVGAVSLRWGMRWGSTSDERAGEMAGDTYLDGGPPASVAMTRAISVDASPDQVWPWIAQLGRGAGWCSIDWLDNGRKASARHIVSWIPETRLGDATAIGYVRHIDAGRTIAWWSDGAKFFGARARLVTSFGLESQGRGTRLVSRMSADATGMSAHIALLAFCVIDSIMAPRQLLGIRDRVEAQGRGKQLPSDVETGSRDQYQLYEVFYANGERAGVPGAEHGERWRRAAIEDEVLIL